MTQFTIPLLAQMKQFKYLTEPNAERYRAIMRFCFLNHMQYKNRLTKDEIYSFLKTLPNFSDYTEKMCEQDLLPYFPIFTIIIDNFDILIATSFSYFEKHMASPLYWFITLYYKK